MWQLLLHLLPAFPLVFYCSKNPEPTRDKKTLPGPNVPKTCCRGLYVVDSDAPSAMGSVQEPPRSEDTVEQSYMKSVSMSGQRPKTSRQRPMSDRAKKTDGSSMSSVQSSTTDSTQLSIQQDQTDSSYFQAKEPAELSASMESN